MNTYRIVDITPIHKGFLSDYWRIALLQNANDNSSKFSIYLEPHTENEASGVIIKKNGEYDPKRLDILKETNGKALNSWKEDDLVNLF